MASGCTNFYKVKKDESCSTIASANSISLDNLYLWNPGLGSECKSLWLDYYVCISAPSRTTTSRTSTGTTTSTPTPIQEGMTKSCTKFYKTKSGDTCANIASSAKVDVLDLYFWNPALGSDCESLWLDYYVCTSGPPRPSSTSRTSTMTGVTTPAPFPANMQAGCKKFYKVKTGDSCSKIIGDAKISEADFKKWNPDLGSSCSVWLDYYYCIGH